MGGDSGATGGHRLRASPPLSTAYIGVRPSLRLPPFVAGSRPRYPPLNPHFFLLARFARSARARFGPCGPPLYPPVSYQPHPPPKKEEKKSLPLPPNLTQKNHPKSCQDRIPIQHPQVTPTQ
ncbi:hypothetical protein O5D80_003113 [Batrachochytrium dendrobatidis]|nr:hypothetical protein O5D80_003113 [Batrachochytrium dendrobatidis]